MFPTHAIYPENICDMSLEDKIPLVVAEAQSRENEFDWAEILKPNHYPDQWHFAGQILEPLMTDDEAPLAALVTNIIESDNWRRLAKKIDEEGY